MVAPDVRTPALALLLCSASALAESQGAFRVWLGTGFDSNARRDFSGGPSNLAREPDLVFSAIGSAEGRYRGASTQANAAYDLGLREFMRLPTENVVIQSATADASVAIGRFLGAGLDARAKDRRGAERDYTDLGAEAFVEFVPDNTVDVKLHGGAHRFLYWDPPRELLLPSRFGYSYGAPELGAYARYRFDKRHSAFAFGDAGFRTYQASAVPKPPNPPTGARRADTVLSGGAGYAYRGPFTLSLTYGYTEQTSNSFGETVLRHRLSATGGARLPWKLTVLAQVVWQPASYPDGVNLSEELNITEDEDTYSQVSLKLARPVSEHVDAELRYALYWGALPKNDLTYSRQLAWLGLTWRL